MSGCLAWVVKTGANRVVGKKVPSSNGLEGGFQNGAYQYQCSRGRISSQEWPLPASVSPGGVPVAP